MSGAPNRFPLAWPAHRPRRDAKNRIRGTFTEANSPKKNGAITMATAAERLEDQIERLGGRYPVLSTNVELRMDGRPRADRAPPSDPGVCVYFDLKGKPYALACDTYTDVAQNIAALANHIDALRRQERYGVASAAESLQAFQALPAPESPVVPVQKWWEVFGVMREQATAETVQTLYRVLAKRRAYDENLMRELNVARDEALKELSHGR